MRRFVLTVILYGYKYPSMKNHLTMTQYARKHKLTRQRIHQLILQRRIPGAVKTQTLGGPADGIWLIPARAKISA